MSTSGSFNPPEDPCPDNVFTAAALVALRDSGGLRVECHYRVQGPVIGTAGNTSATIIELHAVTPSSLSKQASIFQSFNPEGAFVGSYDIDADTSNGGTINELTDHWGNTITDEDSGAIAGHTVHTQVPYHLSGPDLRDNVIDDCVLTGWGALAGQVRDNDLKGSTVDLTGRTGGRFNSNTVVDSSVILNVPVSFVDDNQLTVAVVSHLGTGAGSFSFQGNVMLTGVVSVDSTTTAQVTINNNVVGGSAGGYRVHVQGKTAQPAIISGNRLFNQGNSGTHDLRASGAGLFTFTASEVGDGNLTFNGPGIVDVIGAVLSGATVTTGPGDFVAQRFTAAGSIVNHRGTGVMTLQDAALNASNVLTVVGATRGLGLFGVQAAGSNITQHGTGGPAADTFQAGSTFAQAVVSLNATAPGTPASSYQGVLVTSGGQLNVADHSDNEPVTSCRIDTGAILNLSGAGVFTACRIGSSAVLNLTADAANSVIEGQFTKTPAGANVNRYCTSLGDNWVP